MDFVGVLCVVLGLGHVAAAASVLLRFSNPPPPPLFHVIVMPPLLVAAASVSALGLCLLGDACPNDAPNLVSNRETLTVVYLVADTVVWWLFSVRAIHLTMKRSGRSD